MFGASIRGGLWTGNNSFSAFSADTLNLLIASLAVALLLWVATRHRGAEWMTVGFLACFTLALGYVAVASYIYTHGAATSPSPWYAPVVVTPVLGLAFLGASRWGRVGRGVMALLVIVFGYVLAATYAVRLIPLYGGFQGRTSLAGVARLYGNGWGRLAANLEVVALGPAVAIFLLAGLVILLVAAQQLLLISRRREAK